MSALATQTLFSSPVQHSSFVKNNPNLSSSQKQYSFIQVSYLQVVVEEWPSDPTASVLDSSVRE